MKINTLTLTLLSSLSILTLSGCHSGTSTPTSTGVANVAKVSSEKLSVENDMTTEIDTYFTAQMTPTSPVNAVTQAMSVDTLGLGIANQFRSGIKDMLADGIQGFVFNLLTSLIFPPQKSQEQVMLEQIIKTLDQMQSSLDNLAATTSSMFSFVTQAHLEQYQNAYKTLSSNVSNITGQVGILFRGMVYDNENYETLYNNSALDLKVSTGTQDANGNDIYKTNDKLVRVMLYLAHNKQATIDNIFTPSNMSTLDNTLEDYTNMSDYDAFASSSTLSKLGAKNQKGLSTAKLKATNINLVPSIVMALSNNIRADAGAATQQFKTTAEQYTYLEMKQNNYTGLKYERNRLTSYVLLDSQLKALQGSVFVNVANIQKIQNYSLVLRYLGGDKNVAVPNYLYIYFAQDENNAIAQEAIANNPQNDEATRSAAATNAAKIRQGIFDEATQLLSQAYAKRLTHVMNVINSPSNYNKELFADMKSESMIDEAHAGAVESNKSIYVPGWDFIRGTGIYASNSGAPIAARMTESQPFYTVMTSSGSHEMSMTDMVHNSEVYWDGTYLKAASADKPIHVMQKIGVICHPDSLGAYRIDLIRDVVDKNTLMYCNPDDINYVAEAPKNSDGTFTSGRNSSTKIKFVKDDKLSYHVIPTDQERWYLYPTLPVQAGVRFATDKCYVVNNSDQTTPLKTLLASTNGLTHTGTTTEKVKYISYEQVSGTGIPLKDSQQLAAGVSFDNYTLDYATLGTSSGYTNYIAYAPLYTGTGIAVAKFSRISGDYGVALSPLTHDFYYRSGSASEDHQEDGNLDIFGYKYDMVYTNLAYPVITSANGYTLTQPDSDFYPDSDSPTGLSVKGSSGTADYTVNKNTNLSNNARSGVVLYSDDNTALFFPRTETIGLYDYYSSNYQWKNMRIRSIGNKSWD